METKAVQNKTLISTLEKLHENEKLAKDLCCGLPLDIDQAKRIVSALQADPLSLAAISSWLEALQESLDESIVRIAYTDNTHAASRTFVHNVIHDTHLALEAKKNAILQSLKTGKDPSHVLVEKPGAVAAGALTASHKSKPKSDQHAANARTIQGATAKSLDGKPSGYTEWQP